MQPILKRPFLSFHSRRAGMAGGPKPEGGAMRELRIHGRGGQGAVIASKVLASALFLEGKSVQSFPAFGVERRGAPVTAFLRFADGPIQLRCEVTAPDDVIVLDPTLLKAIDVTQGLKPGGSILINSDRPLDAYAALGKNFRVHVVDASEIARRHGLGSKTQPIVNTAILGAFAACSGLVKLDSVCASITVAIGQRPEINVEAAREAAAAVLGGGTVVQHA
jgi:2-oxoacid:acceptor oxidoreductase gamma subunit (pyruvate/2-ketoisovalerate family)